MYFSGEKFRGKQTKADDIFRGLTIQSLCRANISEEREKNVLEINFKCFGSNEAILAFDLSVLWRLIYYNLQLQERNYFTVKRFHHLLFCTFRQKTGKCNCTSFSSCKFHNRWDLQNCNNLDVNMEGWQMAISLPQLHHFVKYQNHSTFKIPCHV